MGAEETLGNAMNMAATGVGLGIMTMGAMVPLTIMKKMAEDGVTTNVKTAKGKKKQVKVQMPRMKVNLKMPKTNVKKLKIK
jgi:hypothetical protein